MPGRATTRTETFRYVAADADGTPARGSLRADDRRDVARILRRRGLVATNVQPAGLRSLAAEFVGSLLGRRSALRFTEDIATLLGAGVDLDRALAIAADASESEGDAALARQILAAVRGGESLADALAVSPERFSAIYVNTVRAGQAAGALPQVMEQLADYQRARERLRGEVRTALAYPALLLAVGLLSVLVILLYVVPRLSEPFLASGFHPPLPMAVLAGLGALIGSWWPLLLVFAGAAAVGLGALSRSDAARARIDSAVLRVPLLGRPVRKAATARFARAMATLLGAGVPLVAALGAARSVLGNRSMEQAMGTVVGGVKRGEGISGPAERSKALPRFAARLLAVGEETGELAGMFDRLAVIYERETRQSLKRFAALFEPMVILGLGIVVGIMVLSILTALTSVQSMGL